LRPRRAKRAKEILATSHGLRWDIKGGARDWFVFPFGVGFSVLGSVFEMGSRL